MVHKYFHEADGVGAYLRRLTDLLEESGHTVAPFAMQDPRNARSPWESFFVSTGHTHRLRFGLGTISQFKRAWWHPETAHRFRALCEAFKPDVIHVHNWYTHLSPSFLKVAADLGIPVVMTAHDFGFLTANYGLMTTDDHPQLPLSWWQVTTSRFIKGSLIATGVSELLARWHRAQGHHLRGVSKIICLSNYVAGVCRAYGVPADQLIVVPPPLPLLDPSGPPRFEERQGVLMVGRLEGYKGVEDFCTIAASLPAVSFTLIGDGPLRPQLEKIAAQLPNLKIEGWVPAEQVRLAMRQAQLVLVPSRWAEPFGLVALEAQAAGAVTLVSDRGGLPEVIEEGRTGFVLPAKSPASWSHKIEELLNNPAELERLSVAAMARGRSLGQRERFLATMTDIYSEVCQQEP